MMLDITKMSLIIIGAVAAAVFLAQWHPSTGQQARYSNQELQYMYDYQYQDYAYWPF